MQREQVRQAVWSKLAGIARPDSRFHLDFNEYIPDFEGNDQATRRILDLPEYQAASVLFITPDNCLERLRARAARDGKTQIVTTYGIKRGFVEVRPERVPVGAEDYALLLDALEQTGQPISLADIGACYRFDLLVTGASAVSGSGVRFGKGHGYFDLEWAMLYEIGAVTPATPIVAIVHDVQVVEINLEASPHDVVCDIIVTPTRTIHVPNAQKPTTGVLWERLEAGMLESIPPLAELKALRSGQ